MKINSHSLQGKRDANEDNHFIFINNNNTNDKYNPINLFCVFDGHGGKRVSSYLKNYLPQYFIQKNDKPFYSQPKKISLGVRT